MSEYNATKDPKKKKQSKFVNISNDDGDDDQRIAQIFINVTGQLKTNLFKLEKLLKRMVGVFKPFDIIAGYAPIGNKNIINE